MAGWGGEWGRMEGVCGGGCSVGCGGGDGGGGGGGGCGGCQAWPGHQELVGAGAVPQEGTAAGEFGQGKGD